MTDWLDALADFRRRGEACVLVTVVAAEGSTPREAGAKMVISAQRAIGTIGGGTLELQAAETARGLLASGAGRPTLREYPLGPALGQCCGGAVSLLFEPFRRARLDLLVFGAGHVGTELVAVLGDLPISTTWIDQRAERFPPTLPPTVRPCVTDIPEAEIADAPADAAYLVMTHSHDLDLRLVEAVLRRGDFRYLGLIGSATKRARFVRRLGAKGIGTELLSRMTCPVGIDGIKDKHPRAIAIAVAAELLRIADAMPTGREIGASVPMDL